MGLPYIDDATADALRTAAHMLIPVRLDTDDPLRVCNWWRDAEAALPGHPVETYCGGGWMSDLPALLSILDGTAQDVQFHLSGAAPELVDLFMTRAPAVRGLLLEVAAQPFDAAMRPRTAPILLSRMTGQRLSYSFQPAATGSATATITLTVRNGDTSRATGHATHWTPAQYKAEHAGSTLTDWTPRYTASYAVTWPRA